MQAIKREQDRTSPWRPRPSGYRAVFQNRYFMRLWIAQLISQTTQNAINYALAVLINRQTGSSLLGGLILIIFSIPSVLLGPLPGVFVDRVGRRPVMWASNALRALVALGFALVLFLSSDAPLIVSLAYVFTLATSLISQFFMPAEGSSIPLLVGEDELINAISLFTITFTISQALGLLVVGPVMKDLFGTSAVFFLTAGLYAICAGLILAIPRERLWGRERVTRPPHVRYGLGMLLGDLHEGWRVISADAPVAVAVTRLTIAGVVILLIGELAPNFMVKMMGLPPDDMPLIMAPAGIALAVGAIFTPRIARRRGMNYVARTGLLGISAGIALMGLSRSIAYSAHLPTALFYLLVMGVSAIIGFTLDLVNIPAQTTLQERVPEVARGRALAFQQSILNLVAIPALLLVGAVADTIGMSVALILTAAVVFVAWITGFFLNPASPLAGR
jgi:MFS family permease